MPRASKTNMVDGINICQRTADHSRLHAGRRRRLLHVLVVVDGQRERGVDGGGDARWRVEQLYLLLHVEGAVRLRGEPNGGKADHVVLEDLHNAVPYERKRGNLLMI